MTNGYFFLTHENRLPYAPFFLPPSIVDALRCHWIVLNNEVESPPPFFPLFLQEGDISLFLPPSFSLLSACETVWQTGQVHR